VLLGGMGECASVSSIRKILMPAPQWGKLNGNEMHDSRCW